MILYTIDRYRIKCYKCKGPKLKSSNIASNHSFISIKIDGFTKYMYYFLRNNATQFYFEYHGCWYHTDMVTKDGFDLFEYLVEERGELYNLLS